MKKALLSFTAVAVLLFSNIGHAQAPCEGDFTCNGNVDGMDLAVFVEDFGRTDCTGGPSCEGDFDNDSDVDKDDLLLLAEDLGKTDCPPGLRVSTPGAGEVLTAGTWYEITWYGSTSITEVDIELSLDSGDDDYPISVARATPNDGTYIWGPVPFHDPAKLSSECRIRIKDSENPDTIFSESDGVFALNEAESEMTEIVLAEMNCFLGCGSVPPDCGCHPDGPQNDSDRGEGEPYGLSDNVEIYLGTDPFHWDTDRDGYSDEFEVLPPVPGDNKIKNIDGDDWIAALDIDDNDDSEHDGEGLDSDGDSIANYLELYGFVFNFPFFEPWDGDIGVEYFKTNPSQDSTDEDPYLDDEEASGVNMDDFVKSPGNHPNIATFPNITILPEPDINDGKWWDVILNQTITTVEGTSVGEGTDWSEDTYNLTATTDEYHWEATTEVSYSLSDGFGGKASVTYGQSHSDTITTGTVRSEGGSILNTREWSTATCTNPLEAARIKFNLKAVNVGTCPLDDPLLKMNLLIGGKKVRTFDLDLPDMAAGGETGIVLDFEYLTLNELRLLDTGAPLTFKILGLEGTVFGTKPGHEEEWFYYKQNIEEVCARLYLDLGDGNTTEHLVYTGSGEKETPIVTLRDALVWAANAQLIEVEPGVWRPHVRFYQPGGDLGDPAPLDDWYFKLDKETYDSIESYIQNPDFNFFDTELSRKRVVVAKAPPIEPTPKIHWAEIAPRHGIVKAYADDYFFSQNLLEV
ncbi:MAG: binary toxin-like calcium binding domain-containing protein, partial [Planctomycetota bacterium]